MQSHPVWWESWRGQDLLFSDTEGTAGDGGTEGGSSPFFLAWLRLPGEQGVGTEVAPGGGEAAAHRAGEGRDSACAPGTREEALLDSGTFKAAFSCCLFQYPYFLRSGEVSPTCLSHLLSQCSELITSLYYKPVLKGKQTGTGIAPNTVHFKINASQQQEGKLVILVKAERNPTQKEIALVSLVRKLSKS